MKQILAIIIFGGVLAFSSCSQTHTATDSNRHTLSKDTVQVQYKVKETAVQVDTLRNTETITVDPNKEKSLNGDNNQNLNDSTNTNQNDSIK